MKLTEINFEGPYYFYGEKNNLFLQKFEVESGIYLWCVKQLNTDHYFIHYVGESNQIHDRHKQHLTQVLGLNYGVFDFGQMQKGQLVYEWQGMWRDKSKLAVQNTLGNYERVSNEALQTMKSMSIFFAPFSGEMVERRKIEGLIAKELKNSQFDNLYPNDNRTGISKTTFNKKIHIKSAKAIKGLAKEVVI